MAAGLVASIVAFAVGAVLDFAVTANTDQHGFNVHTVGVILMIVGAAGAFLAVLGFALGGNLFRRHRTVIDDGHGNISQREDTYL